MNISGFLFDLDGTLIHSLRDICGVLNLTRQSFALAPMTPEEVRTHIGEGVEQLIQGAIPEVAKRGPEELQRAVHKFREVYMVSPHHGGEVYPGVLETLQILRRQPQAKVAVVTNKYTSVAERTLRHYLPDFAFDAVIGPDRVSARKPSPQHLLEAMQSLGLTAENSLYVGDSQVDLLSARGAGVRFFAAAYGFGGLEARPAAESLADFPQLLVHLGLRA